jgi:hypothetical protein
LRDEKVLPPLPEEIKKVPNIRGRAARLGQKKELLKAQAINKNENKMVIDFKNPPEGMSIKTEKTDDSLWDINNGQQGLL